MYNHKLAKVMVLLDDFRKASEQVGYCSNLEDNDPLRIEAWAKQGETYLKIKKTLQEVLTNAR